MAYAGIGVPLAQLDVVDISGIVASVQHQPRRQLVVDQRKIDHAANAGVGAAVLGLGHRQIGIAQERRRIGLLGDQADGARHGARAVERALRTADDLDPLQIIDMQIGIESLHADGGIVQIQGDERAFLGVRGVYLVGHQTPHVDDVLSRRHGLHVHRRQLADEIRDAAQPLGIERRRGDHRDRHRNLLHGFVAEPVGADHDFLQRKIVAAGRRVRARDSRPARRQRCRHREDHQHKRRRRRRMPRAHGTTMDAGLLSCMSAPVFVAPGGPPCPRTQPYRCFHETVAPAARARFSRCGLSMRKLARTTRGRPTLRPCTLR